MVMLDMLNTFWGRGRNIRDCKFPPFVVCMVGSDTNVEFGSVWRLLSRLFLSSSSANLAFHIYTPLMMMLYTHEFFFHDDDVWRSSWPMFPSTAATADAESPIGTRLK